MTRAMLLSLTLVCFASCRSTEQRGQNADQFDVGLASHKLQVRVAGTEQGKPTVVIESGLGGRIRDWAEVQDEIAKTTRVISYERAGTGGSQPGPRPRSAKRIVAELHEALDKLKAHPPYLLVGHSIGGLYVRTFAATYPHEVHGMVLVDPTMEFKESLTESEIERKLRSIWKSDFTEIETLLNRIHPKMAPVAAQSILELEPYLEQVPASEQQATRDEWLDLFATQSQRLEGMLGFLTEGSRQELFGGTEAMETVRNGLPLKAPTTLLAAGKVLSAGRRSAKRLDRTLSADYLAWSQEVRISRYREFVDSMANADFQIVAGAGHHIHRDRPEAVVDAVLKILSRDNKVTNTQDQLVSMRD